MTVLWRLTAVTSAEGKMPFMSKNPFAFCPSFNSWLLGKQKHSVSIYSSEGEKKEKKDKSQKWSDSYQSRKAGEWLERAGRETMIAVGKWEKLIVREENKTKRQTPLDIRHKMWMRCSQSEKLTVGLWGLTTVWLWCNHPASLFVSALASRGTDTTREHLARVLGRASTNQLAKSCHWQSVCLYMCVCASVCYVSP